jgi:LysM repeat protein
MTKLIRIFYLVFILSPFTLEAQKEIQVSVDKDEKIYLHHKVQAGETFFGISRIFGIGLNEIIQQNYALSRAGLSPGDELRITFDSQRIYGSKKGNYHSLIYEIEPGTTLFSLRRATGLTIDELKKLNNLNDSHLNPGQRLLIGYYHTDPTVDTQPKENITIIENSPPHTLQPKPEPNRESAGTIVHQELSPKNIPETSRILDLKYEEHRGVAVWNQEWNSTTGFYVLHREAPINSIIEIENPMFGRKAYGKVSGRIPSSLYSSDVILIVSDALARHLGVIDQRFFVKVRYLQAE